jgi:hypothetical protein
MRRRATRRFIARRPLAGIGRTGAEQRDAHCRHSEGKSSGKAHVGFSLRLQYCEYSPNSARPHGPHRARDDHN